MPLSWAAVTDERARVAAAKAIELARIMMAGLIGVGRKGVLGG